ncbi:hypothetical protein, partial [Pseudomonas fragi]|uniref:hypothetical protein n=1 Tax=Pseudomonas fragi TaxID=296 RepID=UPI000B5EB170
MVRELLCLMMIYTEINGAPVKKLSEIHENRHGAVGAGLLAIESTRLLKQLASPHREQARSHRSGLLQIPAPVLLAHFAHEL